jgi:excisionase family DNA binding protein
MCRPDYQEEQMQAEKELDLDRLGPTIDVPTAGRILGIGRGSAYEAVRRGEIPAIRIGGRLVVPTAQLRRMLEGE